MLASGWQKAKVSLIAQLPVIGPHGGDVNEGELLLSGKKPLGWIPVVPDNADPFIPENQRRIAMEKKLAEAVKEGRLKSIEVVTRRTAPNGFVWEDKTRHYAQPGLEQDLKTIAAYNEKIWNGQQPDVMPEKSFGDYLGYRKRDQMLFDAIQKYRPYIPQSVVRGIYGFNEYVTQPAYLESILGHPVDKPMDLKQAAQGGDAVKQWQLANKYQYGMDGFEKDPRAAAGWSQAAAERGFAIAQVETGRRFAMGDVLPQNDAAAVKWFTLAADQGYPPGMVSLAYHLEQGRGVERNDAKALELFRKAAELGDGGAHFALGNRYAEGRGVPQDKAEAAFWYKLAARNNITPPAVTEALAQLTPDQTVVLDKRVAEWKETHGSPKDIPVPALKPAPPVSRPPPPTPEELLAKAYARLKQHVAMLPENIKIAMDTPSALVTSNGMVKKWRINSAMETLEQTPEGKELVRIAEETKLPLYVNPDPLARGGGMWEETAVTADRMKGSPQKITLSGFSTEGDFTLTLAHELRHLQQAHLGVINAFQGKLVSPEDHIFQKRVIEADAQATATEIAWQLKEQGKPEAWKAAKAGTVMPAEIADAYEKMATSDPASLTDGRAKRAAFDEWFTAKFAKNGRTVADIYNYSNMNLYPQETEKLQQLKANGAKVEPLTVDDLKKVGSVSALNYLDLPGGRPLDDPYYRRSELNQESGRWLVSLKEKFNRVTAPAGGAKAVTLQHGTSEGYLFSILTEGFKPQYTGAQDKVRAVMEDVAGRGNVTDAQVAELMKKNDFVSARAHEIGNILYTTSSAETAREYAHFYTDQGGEFATKIYKAMGSSEKPRFQDARPVMLELETPEGNIIMRDGTLATEAYETLVKAGPNVKVKSVTFAKKEADGSYTFEGQPALNPVEAMAEIKPEFAKPISAPQANAARTKILKTINDVATGGDVNVTQRESMYVAEADVKDSQGYKTRVTLPDPKFRPQAEEKFGQYGFKGVASEYVMPHGLTAMELSAYLTALDVQEQKGKITARQKAADVSTLLGDIEAANPKIRDLSFDRTSPEKVADVVKGVVNAYSPENLQHHLSPPRVAGYEELRKSAQSKSGLQADIDLTPEALRNISQEMDSKNAEFARDNTVAARPEARAQLSNQDIAFLMDSDYTLRHVSTRTHMNEHLAGPQSGDAFPLSGMTRDVVDALAKEGKIPPRGTLTSAEMMEKYSDVIRPRVQKAFENLIQHNVNFDGLGLSTHMMLLQGMTNSNADRDSYEFGKAGQQIIRPGQIRSSVAMAPGDLDAAAAGGSIEGILQEKLVNSIRGLRTGDASLVEDVRTNSSGIKIANGMFNPLVNDPANAGPIREWSIETLKASINGLQAGDDARLNALAQKAIEADPAAALRAINMLLENGSPNTDVIKKAAEPWAKSAFDGAKTLPAAQRLKLAHDLSGVLEPGNPIFERARQEFAGAVREIAAVNPVEALRKVTYSTDYLREGDPRVQGNLKAYSEVFDNLYRQNPAAALEAMQDQAGHVKTDSSFGKLLAEKTQVAQITVRPAQESDREGLAKLMRKNYFKSDTVTPEQETLVQRRVDQFLHADPKSADKLFVAVDGDTPVAFGSVVRDEKRGGLLGDDLYTRPDYEKKGIASRLLKEFDSFAQSQGETRVNLSVDVNKPELVDYYAKRGWTVQTFPAEGGGTTNVDPANKRVATHLMVKSYDGSVSPAPMVANENASVKVAATEEIRVKPPASGQVESKFLGETAAPRGEVAPVAQTTHILSDPKMSGVGNTGAASVGLVLGAKGLHDSLKAGDNVGAGIATANLATSTLQATEGILEATGNALPVISKVGKFVPGLNIGLTAIDGVYQISKEDTTQHMVERSAVVATTATTGFLIGTAAATTLEAGAITAGVTGVLGTGAVATGIAAVTVAAAPVVLTTAAVLTVAYAGEKAIEAKRAWDDVDATISKNAQPEKRVGYKAADGKPSILGYKHIAVTMLHMSGDMKDENLNGKPARDKNGHILIDEIRKMDMHDSKNIAELERVIDLNIKKQEELLKANDSFIPRWLDPRDRVSKYTNAQMELGDLTGAKAEIEMYKMELKAWDAAHPDDPATTRQEARKPAQAPKPKV